MTILLEGDAVYHGVRLLCVYVLVVSIWFGNSFGVYIVSEDYFNNIVLCLYQLCCHTCIQPMTLCYDSRSFYGYILFDYFTPVLSLLRRRDDVGGLMRTASDMYRHTYDHR